MCVCVCVCVYQNNAQLTLLFLGRARLQIPPHDVLKTTGGRIITLVVYIYMIYTYGMR